MTNRVCAVTAASSLALGLVVLSPLLSYPLSWLPLSVAQSRYSVALPVAAIGAVIALLMWAVAGGRVFVGGRAFPGGRASPRAAGGADGIPANGSPGGSPGVSPSIWLPVALLLVSAVVSVRFSAQPHVSLEFLPVLSANLVLFGVGFCFPRERLAWLGWTWLGVAVVVAALGLVRLGFEPEFLSTIGNRNWLAAYLATGVVVAVAASLAPTTTSLPGRSLCRSVLPLLAAAVLLTAIWCCDSRAAWVALAGAGAISLGGRALGGGRASPRAAPGNGSRGRSPSKLVAGAIVLLIALGAGWWGRDTLQRAWQTEVRPVIWASTLDMIAARPVVGHGLGTFVVEYPPYRRPEYFDRPKVANVTDHAHNEALQIAAEQGALGLAATLWLWGVCFWRGWRRAEGGAEGKDSAEQGAFGARALLGVAVVLFVQGMLDVGLRQPPNQTLWWLVLGMLAGRPAAAVVAGGRREEDEGRDVAGWRVAGWRDVGATFLSRFARTGRDRNVAPAPTLPATSPTTSTMTPTASATTTAPNSFARTGGVWRRAGAVGLAGWLGWSAVVTPLAADVWERRAYLAETRGDFVGAASAARRSLEWAPFRWRTRYLLGASLARVGTHEARQQAIETLSRLQELAPGYANVPTNLGALLLDAGRVTEARPLLERAVALNPRDEQARWLLEQLRLHQPREPL